MTGVKRSHDGMEVDNSSQAPQSPFVPIFEGFRAELDEHQERRERIIKASRDITAASKKIIFSLQRTRELGRPIHVSITKQTEPFYTKIKDLFDSVVPDLQSINAHRYRASITSGIQEYMEAVLFQHYLATCTLLSYPAASATLPTGIFLSHDDYVLGVFDMTGELMRFAVTYMATNGKLPGDILADMQMLRSLLEAVDAGGGRFGGEWEKKLTVTRQSVEKVENGVYSMIVRGKERPKGWRPDADGGGRGERDEVEGY